MYFEFFRITFPTDWETDFLRVQNTEKIKPHVLKYNEVNANRVVVTGNSTEATQGKEEMGVKVMLIMMLGNFIISELKCVSCEVLLKYINWEQENFLLHFTVTGPVI